VLDFRRLFVPRLSRPFSLDAIVNLFRMNDHGFGGIDPEADLMAFDTQDSAGDILPDHDGLT
jgi:hypothetical protein